MTNNCSKSSYICVFIFSKKQGNWFCKNLHNSGIVGRRKLPDPSLNCIFYAVSISVQYKLSFQWTKFDLKCLVGERKYLEDNNRFWIVFLYPHTQCFHFEENSFCFSYTETPSPNCICTFNRPLCLSLNGIRAWTVLSIKRISSFDRHPVFPHLHLLTAIPKRVVHGIPTTPRPFPFPWSKSRGHINPV